MHMQVGEKRFVTLNRNRRRNGGKNLREHRRSSLMNPHQNQIAVPDNEPERSSADDSLDQESPSAEDSEDQGGDDTPDNGDGGGAQNTRITENRWIESFQNPTLRDDEKEVVKKFRPILAHTKSISSPQVPGASNLKQSKDPMIYRYLNNSNHMTDVGVISQISELSDEGAVQRKKRRPKLAQAKSLLRFQMNNILPVSKQNERFLFNDGYSSQNHGSYENAGESLVILYGDATNQIVICLAWFFLVIYMMEIGIREVKRRYRLQQLRQFIHYSLQLASPPNEDT